ncbi:sensor histidine kinase [uncultured Sulfitobacter sp.]|uniref:sensor histidine kinase n=1 Tax=uncultured Sulfitobacter sp. TaxID=191468 RepID=UPI002625C5F7|nr:sensor histidine kinase [uncultured Sulfitobacter sp.]
MADAVQISGSLRSRLTATLIGGAAVLAVLLYLIARTYAAQIAQQGQDNVLGASVTSILDAAVVRDGQVEVDFPYAAFSMLSTPADDRIFYAIYQDDTLLSGYDTLPKAAATPGDVSFDTGSVSGAPVRIATASRRMIGAELRTDITVSVAQTQDSLSGTLTEIGRNVALFGAGFFLLAVALSFWATSATIGPLQRLTRSVMQRGPQDLSPVSRPVPSEMVPLVSSLNSLMGRLDHSLRQSEDFIAEAAHRVRTPLTTVRSYAETTLQRVDKEENRQALRSMVRAIDESSRAAGQLLDHAMITFRADHLDRQPLDLVDLVQDLVQGLTPVADMKDITLRVHGDAVVPYAGDAILLQNAVRNLIDNALKYSPGDGAIDITVKAGPTPTIDVRDEGPGFPQADMARLPTRFARGSNAAGIIGSGLGLTIAQDVAVAHGGRLVLGNDPKGGACVSLSL